MDSGDVDVPAGFELVADENRARILYALAERMREGDGEMSLGFAELRKQAGIRDSGNFNYHLNELLGRFVEETSDGDGYQLTYPGMALVAALVRGDYDSHERLGPEEYGEPCPMCGESLYVVYDQGILQLGCEAEHAMGYNLPPHAVDEDDLPGAVDLMTRRAYTELALVFDERCPMCIGEVTFHLREPPEEGLSSWFDAVCSRCGVHYQLMAGQAVVHHPDVVTFFAEHGTDLRSAPLELTRFGRDDVVTPVSENPPRFEVAIEVDGDRLVAVVDDEASVVDIDVGPGD